ncbi:probable cleavage and polyadenylation specificity factor subunit 2 [Penaeus vannamei]|uniref:Cleavage and polyadenylation specificity factor subunit 2 n=1 Tax=Penaeus vannamei TaxID=6689 RepID=A0A3R7M6W0_PENVA|nr:probable cleavage and polyadenylation specificity factor subunit 2 [Penaeus vannamei]ROT74637.1 putative cleavage and polyadenylation specificity factor subunit 2 [Penaeus vannamei]
MTSIVKFEGVWGVGDETPHCYLLTVDDFTFLLDCGWDEKFDKSYIDRLAKILPRVDCVLISYSDPLHMGALPYLVGKCQLTCPVYATVPVFKMGQMFMYDWFQSHHNYDLVEHFTLDDVDAAFELITQVKYNQSVPMRGKGIGLSISAQPAGHMIGGAIWRIIKDGEGDIVYAVDFNHKKERHLGGCELDKITRPSLLITDAFNASYRQERRRHRDEKLVAQLQETCRNGGNVLIATDTGGRVLEMTHMLEQMWSTRESGLSAYSLAILSNTGYHVIHFAKQMIEWMSEKLTKAFDSLRTNPFSFKHLKFCHNLTDLSRLPSPKVVLASFPDLECGYARELFVQWATNPKNTIILTSRTGPDTLARRLIDNPQIRTFKLLEKRRMKLEGSELDEHYRMKREEEQQQQRIKMEEVESSSDSENEDGLEAGKHDIIVLHEKAGNQSMFRSRKHHPMFPFHEEKIRGDDYGEYINLEDFDISSMKDDNKENLENLQIPYEDDDLMDIEEPPSKCVSQTVTVRVTAQVLFIDFEGRSDGESIRKIVEAMHPLRVILVRGSPTDLQAFSQNIRSMTKAKVFTPSLGEVVNASMESHIYQVKLAESLVSSLMLKPAGREVEVAWVDGIVSFPTESIDEAVEEGDRQVIASESQQDREMPTLSVVPAETAPLHNPVFINDIRLSEFKQVLSRAGISSEFNAGILWCANGTLALKKQESGSLSLEGPMSADYFEIRELLYSQYAMI